MRVEEVIGVLVEVVMLVITLMALLGVQEKLKPGLFL